MLLPGAVTVMGAALFSLCLQIPANTGLERVWTSGEADEFVFRVIFPIFIALVFMLYR